MYTKKTINPVHAIKIFLLLAFVFSGIYFSIPWLERVYRAWAITDGDVTLGPAAAVDTNTDITSSVANLGTDTAVYRWVKGSATGFVEFLLPFHNTPLADFSGNSYSITTNGVPTNHSAISGNCQIGSCVEFDGSQSYYISGDVLNPSAGTINFWMKTTTDNRDLFNTHSGASNQNTLFIDSGVLNLVVCGGVPCPHVTTASAPVVDGNWHMITATWQVGGIRELFVDGVSVDSEGATPLFTPGVNFEIGTKTWTEVPYIGHFDDWSIYKIVLSSDQIAQMYTDGAATLGGPTVIKSSETLPGQTWRLFTTPISNSGVVGNTILSNGNVFVTGSQLEPADITVNSADESESLTATVNAAPVGSSVAYMWYQNGNPLSLVHLPFSDDAIQVDMSPNENNGTVVGTPTFHSQASGNCKVGGCYEFDGIADSAVNLPVNFFSFPSVDPFTVSVWFKTSTGGVIFGQQDAPAYGGATAWLPAIYVGSDGKLYAEVFWNGAVSPLASSGIVNDNDWHHVAVSYNGTTQYLYLDGSLLGSQAHTQTGYAANYYYNIGTGYTTFWTAGGIDKFTGFIDDFTVFNSLLTQSQIQQIVTDVNAGRPTMATIPASQHAFNEVWALDAAEIGSFFGPMEIATVTIASAPATTVSAVAPVGISPYEVNIEVNYTCTLDGGGSATRDVLVEFSTNGGGAYANATLVSSSQGTLNGSLIEGITCDGTQRSFVWDSLSDSVALGGSNGTVRMRVTAQVGSTTPGVSSNFTVENPSLITVSVDTIMNPGAFNANSVYRVTGVGTELTINQEHGDASIDIYGLIVEDGAIVNHTASTAGQTYKIDLNVASLVNIESGGAINVDGLGCTEITYPAGDGTCINSGLNGAFNGASHAGKGGGGSLGPIYGSTTQPTLQGGGGSTGGFGGVAGVGGGVVKITTEDFILAGSIVANGTSGSASGGSAGSVWISVTNQFTGTGTILANGGGSSSNGIPGGSGGRIALYFDSGVVGNPTASTLLSSFTVTAYGGSDFGVQASPQGSAGTIYVEDTATHTGGLGDVSIINNVVPSLAYVDLGSVVVFNAITVEDNRLQAEELILEILDLSGSSTLFHPATTLGAVETLEIAATTLNVSVGSSIDVVGLGCVENTYPSGGICIGAGLNGAFNGASHAGKGGGSSLGPIYGSITQPILPGGGGSTGGFGGVAGIGGGAVKITVTDFSFDGSIMANGDTQSASGGSGGSVWISVTNQFTGTGTISANGGGSTNNGIPGGSGGRIALYFDSSVGGNPTASTLLSSFTVTAYGGSDFGVQASPQGSAGTIYVEDTATHAVGLGDVSIINDVVPSLAYVDLGAPIAFNAITVEDNRLQAQELTPVTLNLNGSSTLFHPAATSSGPVEDLEITVTSLTISAGSSIDIQGLGCGDSEYPSGGNCVVSGIGPAFEGASHGGQGGGGSGAIVYGSITQPFLPGGGGSTGGFGGTAGVGGGAVKITATDFAFAGAIDAGGDTQSASGGSGGSVWISVTDQFTGTGTISVNGGGSSNNGIAGGGGGRIALYFDSSVVGNPTAATALSTFTVTAYGGSDLGVNASVQGAAGTLYIEDTNTHALGEGDLYVDNNNLVATDASTPLFYTGVTSYTVNNLSVINQAIALIDNPCSGTPALTVLGQISLAGGGTITNNQPVTCTVSVPAPTIVTTVLDAGLVGVGYSDFIEGTGGYSPYTWACLDGVGGSIVGCNTVLPAWASLNTSTGEVTGTPGGGDVGTTVFAVRLTDGNPGGAQTDDESITLSVTSAPTAPTGLVVHNTNAVASGTSNPSAIDTTPVFSAVCQDPNLGDTCTKYRVQVASDAGFTSLLWDSGAAGTSMTSTTIGGLAPNIAYAGSALSTGGVQYYWRIKFWDNNNAEGPFSSSGDFFITSTTPTAPTVLFANSSNAQIGQASPAVNILSSFPVFSAIYNDPDATDQAIAYRLQVAVDNGFATIVYDSAQTAMTACNQGVRCSDVAYAGTALPLDEAQYFWRISYYDAAGLQSPFSATASFTMGLGGGSSTGSSQKVGGGQQTGQVVPPIVITTPPSAPTPGATTIGPNSITYTFVDNATTETGFQLIGSNGIVLVDDPSINLSSITETGLSSNTVYENRKIASYNEIGSSTAGQSYTPVVTAMPDVTPQLISRTDTTLTIGIEQNVNNLTLGQSGLIFEVVIPATATTQERVLQSALVQTPSYTFTDIPKDVDVQVRVKAQNQAGLQTVFSPFETIDAGAVAAIYELSLSARENSLGTLPRPINPNKKISVTIVLANRTAEVRENVYLNLSIPDYMKFVSNSLSINGTLQTDRPDQDNGQADKNSVNAIWATIGPNEGKVVSFLLEFDQVALRGLWEYQQKQAGQVRAGAVQAAANPVLVLSAVAADSLGGSFYSNSIEIEPELGVYELEENQNNQQPEQQQNNQQPQENNQSEVQQEQGSQNESESNQQGQSQNNQSQQTGNQAVDTVPNESSTTQSQTSQGNFSVTVQNDQNSVTVTGQGQVQGDQVIFTGTTSQPFTELTLIIGGSVVINITSDANGEWQTFVDADRLSSVSSESGSIDVELIVHRNDLTSERVKVADLVLEKDREGVVTEFILQQPTLTVTEQIQEVETPAQFTLAVAAPVVIAASAPLWGYLPYLPTLIFHFFTWMLGLTKKREEDQIGVVYDAITKQPVSLAIVRIYNVDTQQLVKTEVTDKLGRYDALLEPGSYRIQVIKPQYAFPSEIVKEASDGVYSHVYQGTFVVAVDKLSVPDLPIDPISFAREWHIREGIRKVWAAVQRVGEILAIPVLLVGSVSSLAMVVSRPDNVYAWIFSGLYVALLVLQLILRKKPEHPWGIVYDSGTNMALPLTTIQLIDREFGKVLKSRLSDYEGRYSFLLNAGDYIINASKEGYTMDEQAKTDKHHRPLQKMVKVQKDQARIKGDIAMRSEQ